MLKLNHANATMFVKVKTFMRVLIFLLYFLFVVALDGLCTASTDPARDKDTKVDRSSRASHLKTRSFKTLSIAAPLANQQEFYLDQFVETPTNEEEDLRQKIDATAERVVRESRLVESLDEKSLLDLPVGIEKRVGELSYVLLIDSVMMTPTESFLFASMRFAIPAANKNIHLMASHVKFSREGGITGEGRLMLVGDYKFKLDTNNYLLIKGSQQRTFAEFDCKGYKQFSLDADLVISNRLIVPEVNGVRNENGNVAINFLTTITSFDDILVNVNVPNFQVRQLKDVTFSIHDAVLDFSDSRNPLGVNFPVEYQANSPLLSEGNFNLWRGVFIKSLSVTLPPQFETTEVRSPSLARVSFAAKDLILDNVGITGTLSASNLISFEKGRISKWKFSLDNIHLGFVMNEVRDGGFSGRLGLPITNVTSCSSSDSVKAGLRVMRYTAIIQEGNEYLMNVVTSDSLNFSLWKADVRLGAGSFVEVKLEKGKFIPRAVLHGEMTMNAGLSSDKCGKANAEHSKNLKLTKITFQNLVVQAFRPYVQVGQFSLGAPSSDANMGGFPISIKSISGTSNENEISLGIEVSLSLVGDDGGAFGADGKFAVKAKPVESDTDIAYEFDRIDIGGFRINVVKGPFKFKGNLNFYKEDPVYGNGISGTVDATFNNLLTLQASAIFGRINTTRYWYTDALVTFKNGVTIFPGVAFYSFGGGAYYRMRIDDKKVGSDLGQTASGVAYVPDDKVAFGFKAITSLGVQPGKESFNAELTYEMAFNSNGGVKYVNLRGNGFFMTPPVEENPASLKTKTGLLAKVAKQFGGGAGNLNEGGNNATAQIHGEPSAAGARAQVWVAANINYDFDHNTLHGNLKAYINAAKGLIKGAGPNGLAGEAVLHFAPGEWYVYIGRPEYENRFAVELVGMARLDAYFVMGSVIPNSPPPSPEVAEILSDYDLNYMGDLNALGSGAGVGFGASFKVDTGDLTFLVFYGRFSAGLGFDIMLKDYGNVQCEGSGELGINGWYANAQVYGFFQGTIGIGVTIWGRDMKLPILDLGAAVIAQAKLPNPTWIKGIAGGYYSVLGGLVKGKCDFEIEIGKECTMKANSPEYSILESIDILAQTTPSNDAKEVNVFTTPQAIFNYEMGKEYEHVDINNQLIKFKISMDAFRILDNGSPVDAQLKWNSDRTVAALTPKEALPGQRKLQLEVVVSFMENKNGYWTIGMSGDQKLTKTYSFVFNSGEAPPFIPEDNIAYSYPTSNQYNVYQDESAHGYYKLRQGQAYLFPNTTAQKNVVRFTSSDGGSTEVAFTYQTSSNEIQFPFPKNLRNNQIYEVQLVSLPTAASKGVDSNIDTSRVTAQGYSPTEVSIRKIRATSNLTQQKEKIVYTSHFRTSRYNSLKDKIVSLQPSSGWRDPIITGVHAIGSNIAGPEPFSFEEIYGSEKHGPLISLEADLKNSSWFNNSIFPLIYEGYPINNLFKIRTSNRDPSVLGVVPTRAVFLYQYPFRIFLTEDAASAKSVPAISTVGRFNYYLAYYMYYDYLDLASQAANHLASNGESSPRIIKLLTEKFPPIRAGNYDVKIHYSLPGRNSYTSTYVHTINNPID